MRPDITHGYMGEITPGEKVESWRKERISRAESNCLLVSFNLKL